MLAGLLFVLMVASLEIMRKAYPLPYDHFSELLLKRSGMRDVAGIVLGFRSLTADIAWIDFMQYVGGEVLPDEDPDRPFDFLYEFGMRVIRLDPFYRSAILSAAGMLAWFRNVKRPEEALSLLAEGIKKDPTFWPYRTYAAAITFQMEQGESTEAIQLLESALVMDDCPMMLKYMLANIYKNEKMYGKGIALWLSVLESDEKEYHDHAARQIEILRELMDEQKRGHSSVD